MATNFPTSLDALTNPLSTDELTSPSHADQHANANDAIEAIQAAIGTTAAPVLAKLASPTFTGTLTADTISATGDIGTTGRGEFRTNAAAGRGVGIGGGTGDTTAILQFINNAFGAQWGNITASSAGALAINAYDGTAGSIALNASSITTSTPITGSIAQTVYTVFSSGYSRTNTSATPADITGFNMSITPKKTGNKIIILAQIAAYSICDGYIQLKKNGSLVANPLIALPRVDFIYDDAQFYAQYVDTAASTAAITYQFSGSATGCGGFLGVNSQGGISSTIMIEVQS